MTNDLVVSLGEVLDKTAPQLYRNPRLVLEVGNHYINNLGFLIKLIKRKMRACCSDGKTFNHQFLDEDGQRYAPNGAALKGSVGGQPSLYCRSLADKALKVKVGQRYEMRWKDGGVTRYTVMGVGPKGYEVRWDNEALHWIQYGCPLNYDSVLIS